MREQFIREYALLLLSIQAQSTSEKIAVVLAASSVVLNDQKTFQRYARQLATLSYLTKKYLGPHSVTYVDAPVQRTQEEINQFQIQSRGGQDFDVISDDLTHVYANSSHNTITIEQKPSHQPSRILFSEYEKLVQSQQCWVQKHVAPFCIVIE